MEREQNPDQSHYSRHEFSSEILQNAPGELPSGAAAKKCGEDRCGGSQGNLAAILAQRTLRMLAKTMLHPPGEPLCHQSLSFGADCGFIAFSPQIAPVIQARL